VQPNESDHRTLYSEFEIGRVQYGPGIIRANSNLFNNPSIKNIILNELKTESNNMPAIWNPHTKLDFTKYKLREIMLREGKKIANSNRSKLEYANEEINTLEKALDSLLSKPNNDIDSLQKIDSLRESLLIAKADIEDLKNEEANRLIFRSKAKWAEKGEKSNKYFLNLLKERQKAMIIRKIISNGSIYHKQDEISKAITSFYKKLYKKQTDISPPDDSRLFKDLPKLNPDQKVMLDKPVTLDELKQTLSTCDESAPGPDGLTYRTIEYTWSILGPLILESWTFSQKIGATSPSQKNAVISLLEKKGKDKSKLENLRPISLSNCDIKLCTKTLALRTNLVLPTILSTTQTGYIPGRQVNDNSRLLEELIEKYKRSNNQAYLITLDARKAFDSVDHTYLFHILKLFDFPTNYINNIRTIYKDLNASILVNGFTSEHIDIEQSVKQGDALSCALFIIAIEPLLRQLNKNINIKGIELNSEIDNREHELKNMSFADDITAICTNIEGIQYIIDEYMNFSKYSGIKLNIEKTEIMILGKKTNETIIFNICHDNMIIKIKESTKVKICGITFSNNSDEAYKENILDKISKLERHLNIWKQRNLTLQGKILIVKTFALSQLIYSLQATSIRAPELKKIDDIVFRFIWNTKAFSSRCIHKIKKDVLKATVDKGGLNAPDISLIDRAIKFKHLIRCTNSTHPVSIMVKNEMQRINFKVCKYSKCIPSYSMYIQNVIDTNTMLEKLLTNDITEMSFETAGINTHYFQLLQNHVLMDSTFYNPQMLNMIKRLKSNGIVTLRDLYKEREHSTRPNIRLDCQLIYSKIPKPWKTLMSLSKKDHPVSESFSFSLNKAKNITCITQKEIYLRLNQNSGIKNITEFINTKHNTNFSNVNKVFSKIKQTTSIKALQNVQYKILHNIYPTQLHLYRWKIKNNDQCSYCNTTETLRHAVYDCVIARETRHNLELIINSTLNINMKLSYNDVLVGLNNNNNIREIIQSDKLVIDELLIDLKRSLILQRENKRILTNIDIKNSILSQIKIRRAIGKKPSNFEIQFCI